MNLIKWGVAWTEVRGGRGKRRGGRGAVGPFASFLLVSALDVCVIARRATCRVRACDNENTKESTCMVCMCELNTTIRIVNIYVEPTRGKQAKRGEVREGLASIDRSDRRTDGR